MKYDYSYQFLKIVLRFIKRSAIFFLLATPFFVITAAALGETGQDVSIQPVLTKTNGETEKCEMPRLKEKINGAYGLRTGRYGILTLSIGPKLNKLYHLHKTMTDCELRLLAELYLFPAQEELSNFKWREAVKMLLAMHEEKGIRAINDVFNSSTHPTDQVNLEIMIKDIESLIKLKPWTGLDEYKKDIRSIKS